jgi:hypothetical protein
VGTNGFPKRHLQVGLPNRAAGRPLLWRVHQAYAKLVVSSSQQLCLAPGVAVDLQEAFRVAYRMLDSADACEDILNLDTLSVLSSICCRMVRGRLGGHTSRAVSPPAAARS